LKETFNVNLPVCFEAVELKEGLEKSQSNVDRPDALSFVGEAVNVVLHELRSLRNTELDQSVRLLSGKPAEAHQQIAGKLFRALTFK
jgi:hypothetical protein